MILEGGISKDYTQNWDKNGNIYYTDENGQVVDFKVNPFAKLANKVKATATNIGNWINETDPNSEAYKQKVSAIVGLETLPLGLGRFATQQIAKGLTPYVGRKIAQNMAQGIGSGVAGGGIGGGLEAGLNDRNIAIGGLQGATVGGLLGGLGGYGLGKVAQKFERAKLPNNPQIQEQYFNDYVADLNNKTKAMADFRAGKLGMKNGKMQLAYDLAGDEVPLTETQAFKKWSGNTPMVSSKEALDYPFKTGQGVTVEGYHGTKRGDRVGSEFKKERATSGPMAFFSSDKDIATNYSKGKEDTSLSEEMMDYWQWFKYRDKNGNLKPLGDAWWDLSPDERWAVAKNAPHISFDDEADNIIFDQANNRGVGNYDYALKQYRNNPLKALIDGWLEGGSLYGREDDFLKVLEKAGVNMDNIDYIDPYTDHSKVYDVYLSMKKPLVTNDIPNDLVERLSAEAPNNPAKYQDGYGVDLWDKNRRDGVEWVNELKNDIAAGENSHAWTSIPDWVTEEMKKQGYDGIIDMGGKGGGEIHKVYIPFEPTQIKSVNNQGTFDPTNPNIYKSILAPIGAGALAERLLNKEYNERNSY